MPAISIIMLTYNRQNFVRRAIESVLQQSFHDFEMIIVDNGSTDDSGRICMEMAQKDKRLTLIGKNRGNIGSGRNCGVDIARGEYVVFIDDDDYCLPDFLAFLYDTAVKNKADISVCGSYKEEKGLLLPNGNYIYDDLYLMHAEQAVENYLWRRLYNCAMPTKLIRRELFDKIRFPEQGNYDDITTAYKFFAHAHIVAAKGIPQYVFRRHGGNNSSAATKHHMLNPEQLMEYLQAFKDRTSYLSEILPNLVPLARYTEWSYMISMIEKVHKFNLKNCQGMKEYMRKELLNNLDEFVNGKFILNFEKEWVKRFVNQIEPVAI